MTGHLMDISSKPAFAYRRLLSLFMQRVLKMKMAWSGCMSEFQLAITEGRIVGDVCVEVYVHPELIDNISVDTYYSYHHETKQMKEIVQTAVATFGEPVMIQ